MGHTASSIFESHYFSQDIRFDVQGAVSGQDDALIVASSVSMGAYANPDAPFRLTTEQRAEAWAHPNVLSKLKLVEELKVDLELNYGSIHKSIGSLSYNEYREAFTILQRERARQERLLFSRLRLDYFLFSAEDEISRQLCDSIDADDELMINSQRLTSTNVPSRQAFANVCYELWPSADASARPSLQMQAMGHLIELCDQQDAWWHGSRLHLQPQLYADCSEVDSISDRGLDSSGGDTGIGEVVNLVPDYGVEQTSAGDSTPELLIRDHDDRWNNYYLTTCADKLRLKVGDAPYAADFWQKHCMFCFSNEKAHTAIRLKQWERVDVLRKHMFMMHISKLTDVQVKLCPLPYCKQKLNGRKHLLNHAKAEHNFSMSKHFKLIHCNRQNTKATNNQADAHHEECKSSELRVHNYTPRAPILVHDAKEEGQPQGRYTWLSPITGPAAPIVISDSE